MAKEVHDVLKPGAFLGKNLANDLPLGKYYGGFVGGFMGQFPGAGLDEASK